MTTDEKKALTLMGIASAKLETGENFSALQQYEAAAKFDVWFKPHALLGAAYAKGRLSMFEPAISDLEALLSNKDIAPENSVFRADVLRCLCEVLGIQHTEPGRISELLQEAARIYRHHTILASYGSVWYLQGLIEEDPNKAFERIEEGALFSRVHTPGVGPFQTGLEPARSIASGAVPEAALALIAGGVS